MSKRPNVGLFGVVPFVVGDLTYRKLPRSLHGRDQGGRRSDPSPVIGIPDTRSASMVSVRKRAPPRGNLSPTKSPRASSPGSGPRATRLSAGARYGLRLKRGDHWRADREVSRRLGVAQEPPWAGALLRLFFHGAGISR
jgi:hypothetical protein